MFHELDVPRCEEQTANYIGKWFVVNATYDGFLTHDGKNELKVKSLNKDNLEIFFWDNELDALRDMERYYNGWARVFPFANVLAALDSAVVQPTSDVIESEVMRFE